MKNDHTEVIVSSLPSCDLCTFSSSLASYDVNVPGAGGGWANLCQEHFEQSGAELGLGKGQKLILETK